MPHDLRIELRPRNNPLWHVIHDECKNVAQWCQRYGFCQSAVGELLNLKRHPLLRDGSWSLQCTKISEAVGISCDELFPLHLYDEIGPDIRVVEVDSFSALEDQRAVLNIADQRQDLSRLGDQLEQHEIIEKVLKKLTYREREIVKLRVGFDGSPPYTLEEVGRIFKVTKDRIRQIEAKAFNKLRRENQLEELVSSAIPS